MVHVLIDPFAFERFRSLLDQPSDNFETGFMTFLTQMIFRDLKQYRWHTLLAASMLEMSDIRPLHASDMIRQKNFNENPYLEEYFDSAVVQPPLYMMVEIMEQFHHVELGKVPRVTE